MSKLQEKPVPKGSDKEFAFDYEAFRDTIGTVDESGKRRWIYPRKPKGRFHNWRRIVAAILLVLFFTGPFLRLNGEPFLLFNFIERRFIIFGLTFWPQDFHLFVLAMITFMIFIVLFTVIFGRVWCGWACPQTIFMEMVFRKIEYWIEGDRTQQKKLNDGPWNAEKIRKKTFKLTIFGAIALLMGNTVMAYIVGLDKLSLMIQEGPFAHWSMFTGVVVFSGIIFFVFTWFREQACIAVCPYGRLQGVLLDKDSLAVSYDPVRGEPRGKLRKGQDPDQRGDCIDCGLCVQVCPTGIDIRNGNQMECVNCTACIDACDSVMDKVGFDRGLIRIASLNQIMENKPFKVTTRIIAYSLVLVALLSITGFLLTTRSEVEATVIRTPGKLYSLTEDGYVSNLYNLQLANKTRQEFEDVTLELLGVEESRIKVAGTQVNVPARGIFDGVIIIELPPEILNGPQNRFKLQLSVGDRILDTKEIAFLGPVKKPGSGSSK